MFYNRITEWMLLVTNGTCKLSPFSSSIAKLWKILSQRVSGLIYVCIWSSTIIIKCVIIIFFFFFGGKEFGDFKSFFFSRWFYISSNPPDGSPPLTRSRTRLTNSVEWPAIFTSKATQKLIINHQILINSLQSKSSINSLQSNSLI